MYEMRCETARNPTRKIEGMMTLDTDKIDDVALAIFSLTCPPDQNSTKEARQVCPPR
jgi:hypothetical protein